jgi:hypothetical protein
VSPHCRFTPHFLQCFQIPWGLATIFNREKISDSYFSKYNRRSLHKVQNGHEGCLEAFSTANRLDFEICNQCMALV